MSESLLTKIASGDRDAVSQCMEKYGGLVWSLARRLTPSGDDPEDAVQEIFIELWKNADRFDPSKGEETVFVAMIARRRLIDRRRKANRAPDMSPINEVFEPGVSHDRIEHSTDAALAAKVIGELKPEQKRMLLLSLQLGLSHGEIAQVTDTAIGTVKSHIRRGLIAVREKLNARQRREA